MQHVDVKEQRSYNLRLLALHSDTSKRPVVKHAIRTRREAKLLDKRQQTVEALWRGSNLAQKRVYNNKK